MPNNVQYSVVRDALVSSFFTETSSLSAPMIFTSGDGYCYVKGELIETSSFTNTMKLDIDGNLTARYFFESGSLGSSGPTSFTFRQAGSVINQQGGASNLSQSITMTNITAGNLIIIGCKSEGGIGSTFVSMSDGTSVLAMDAETSSSTGDNKFVFGYHTSSLASGTVTYTLLRSAAAGWYSTFALEFAYTGSVSFGASNGTASVSSTKLSSSVITTGAPASVVVGSYAQFAALTPSNLKIGGIDKDGFEPNPFFVSNPIVWWRVLTDVVADCEATCDLTPTGPWVSRILNIKST